MSPGATIKQWRGVQFLFYERGLYVTLEIHSHHSNIVHRDLKPDNLMLNDRGCLVLVDFGFAKEVEQKVTIKGGLNLDVLFRLTRQLELYN